MSESAERKDAKIGQAYGGITLWGVPYGRLGIELACEHLKAAFTKRYRNQHDATQALLEHNERVVSRCGILMSFSGLLIAVSLFIATNNGLLTSPWQKVTYYLTMAIWVFFTLRMLWSLKHELPPPWAFDAEGDFDFTAKLYVRRMGLYNLALVATVFCFCIILLLLAPLSVRLVDLIFAHG